MSDPLQDHRDRLIVSCAWCRSILNRERGMAISADATSTIAVTHTICPVCLSRHFGEQLQNEERRPVAIEPAEKPPASIPLSHRARMVGNVLLFALMAASCGTRSPALTARTMPHPDGCFVQVWDQPRFVGASDFINGPRRYATLQDLPGRHNWANRIHSLKLGDSASVTVWSEDHFRGTPVNFTEDSQEPQRSAAVAPKIGSLSISCRTMATD
jgi:hypothetical protein